MAQPMAQCVFTSLSGQLCVVAGISPDHMADIARGVIRGVARGQAPERVVGEIVRLVVVNSQPHAPLRVGQLRFPDHPTVHVRYQGRGSYTLMPPARPGQTVKPESLEVEQDAAGPETMTPRGDAALSWATERTEIVIDSMLGQVVFSARIEAGVVVPLLLRALTDHGVHHEYSSGLGTIVKTLALGVKPPGGFTADLRRSEEARHTLWFRHLPGARWLVAQTDTAGISGPEEWQLLSPVPEASSALAS